MLSRRDVDQFAKVCTDIGNELADECGFVSIRRLLNRFQAQLHIRPLLVEGMLAKAETQEHPWAVLVDAETFPISESQIDRETHLHPLPSRLRNTIAHELVHSLPFRVQEFGIHLRQPTGGTLKDLVEAIEALTESLSPLLLFPYEALSRLIALQTEPISLRTLAEVRHKLGISRHLLVSRLSMLPLTDVNRSRVGLRNVGIGLGEWRGKGAPMFRKWPLFVNYVGNTVPDFLHKLRQQDFLPIHTIAPTEAFSACNERPLELECKAGTATAPDFKTMRVRLSIEPEAKKRAGFLFLVQGVD